MKREFYQTTPTNPVKKGFYHWSQIEKLAMGYYEDDDGYLKVTLKEGAEPSEKASGMMWMWLRVSERGTAVKHPDADNREHYEYIDEFDEFRKTEALRAIRKERQVITDPLRIRELLTCDVTSIETFPQEDFGRIRSHQVSPLTAKLVSVVFGSDRREAVRKVCVERSGRLSQMLSNLPHYTTGELPPRQPIPLGRDLTQEHCDTFLNDLIENNQNKD